jgi:hypothetical protein
MLRYYLFILITVTSELNYFYSQAIFLMISALGAFHQTDRLFSYLTTVFQLRKFYNTLWLDGYECWNGDVWKQSVVAYLI